uniref:Uncharacterized protein n=1 Tax=Candidatus Kentrum sp. LPFa TaxID=2126335 RepID=A0A450WWT5_9GAMM|nr:MAG: hypothetical protein BECKLPF1236B_GA0070989_12581 [Candidatus Kentron sp. LPFa]
MVDARSDPPYGPESGLLFHSNISLIFLDRFVQDFSTNGLRKLPIFLRFRFAWPGMARAKRSLKMLEDRISCKLPAFAILSALG